MFYVLRTGITWRDLPERFVPWGSVYTRFRRWCALGLFARLLAAVAKGAKGELRYIDCSHIKLHQDGSNPRGGQIRFLRKTDYAWPIRFLKNSTFPPGVAFAFSTASALVCYWHRATRHTPLHPKHAPPGQESEP